MPHTMTLAAGCIMTLACISCARSFLDASRAENHVRAFFLKGEAALCFLALGFLGATRCSLPSFSWKVAVGLFLGLIGDELLAMRYIRKERFNLYFSAGAVAFALGHCMYIWALLGYAEGAVLPALLMAAVLFTASLVYLRHMEFKPGKLSAGAFAYIMIVVLMGSVALATAFISRNTGALLFGLGGVCFILSDNVLCIYCFGRDRRFGMNVFLHVSYYAAQILIGWSLYLI